MCIRANLKINSQNHLEISGCDTVELSKKFGTPLYVIDENYVRTMMRTFKNALSSYKGESEVLYASKAFSCKAIYAIAKSENIGVDVVSGGELYTALTAKFPANKVFMHGNNKLYTELEEAVMNSVAVIVIDSLIEANLVEELCNKYAKKQDVIIRLNPGVEAHTHAFVQTARTDSKFGFSIDDGTALEMTEYLLKLKNVQLKGYHCHIGSQIFEKQSYVLAVEKMFNFILDVKQKLNFETSILNMGGGFGVYYSDSDCKLTLSDYTDYITTIANKVEELAKNNNLKLPKLVIEPGRAIVGEAGITLYTVGTVKEIPNLKTYVAVDGGMFDNPRYALYQSKYNVLKANSADEPCIQKVSIAGKCCESGDLIAVDVALPKVCRGDLIAVLTTGAYNYSMASNYNRNLIPPVVLVKDGKASYIVKPQTYDDIIRNDVIPEYLINE